MYLAGIFKIKQPLHYYYSYYNTTRCTACPSAQAKGLPAAYICEGTIIDTDRDSDATNDKLTNDKPLPP
jgi:hypothetical protein